MNIGGVIFDLNGTLTLPGPDRKQLLQQLSLPSDTEDILNVVLRREEPEKTRSLKIIEQYEQDKIKRMELQPHLVELLDFISSNDVKIAMLTSNTIGNVKHFQSFLQTEIDKASGKTLKASSIFSPVSHNHCAQHGYVCVAVCTVTVLLNVSICDWICENCP